MEPYDEINKIMSSARPKDDLSPVDDVVAAFGRHASDARPMKLTRKEKRRLKREFKQQMKGAGAQASEAQAAYKSQVRNERRQAKSIAQQLKERDKELSGQTRHERKKRREAREVADFIGYERMFVDGICEVEPGLFSQTIEFPDISYQSAREDRQKDIFNVLCELLDYFGTETCVQFSVVNTPILKEEVGHRTFFDEAAQASEGGRADAASFNEILNEKMKEGVSNIRRDRYLTYATSSTSLDDVRPTLARIRNDVQGSLKKIECAARVVDGAERLGVVHSLLRPGVPFDFSYERDIHMHSALTTKDFVAPGCIDFKPDSTNACITLDGVWAQTLVIRQFGSELTDRALSDIVDLPIPMCVTWYVQAWEKSKAVNFVKSRASWIDKSIIDEQQRAIRKGYDFTIVPQELEFSKNEAMEVLDQLQKKAQRYFTFTGLVYTYAETKEELDERVIQIISTARRNGIEVQTLDFRQREGLNSILPLGHNHVDVSRNLTTAQVAMLVPFATQELDHEGGTYYGQNKNSNNLVICNRKSLASPVGFISGKTGSGKSFFVKQEIEGTILTNKSDQVIIFDRAAEYCLLTRHHGGSEFKFAVDSDTHLNPFDMSSLGDMSREAQIAFKVDAMLAQAAASAAESGRGLSEEEQSIIQRAVEAAFAVAEAREPGSAPLLEDFYQQLVAQPEAQASSIALRYERFVRGSMSFFNNRSNVDWSNRVIDVNFKELPDSMLVFTLITMCEAARNQMYKNFDAGRRTWIYVEVIQSMFKYPTVLNYFSRFANEARKFGGLITGITQNSVAMLQNENARNIVLNADFIMLLKQSAVDRGAWVDLLNLSNQEASTIDESCDPGSGLLIAGAARVPVVGNFPKGNALYELFSTDPNETAERKQRERFAANTTREGA